MEKWKELAAKSERYKDFIILDKPIEFGTLFVGQEIPVVQIHDTTIVGEGEKEYLVGFAGSFRWDGENIVPLDGDSYSSKMSVLGYAWFVDSDGNKCFDVLVSDW